ncbi:MAG: nucleotidyltransferase domain-containing protein, partial [Oligoflexia bacterium]|nr:nucleotidyltransferase domain-containing protein [Oligoflexia bacterium]
MLVFFNTMDNSLFNQIIAELKDSLQKLYGPSLAKVIIFGSWARGTATSESDIDIAVVLKGNIMQGKEIDKMSDIVTE